MLTTSITRFPVITKCSRLRKRILQDVIAKWRFTLNHANSDRESNVFLTLSRGRASRYTEASVSTSSFVLWNRHFVFCTRNHHLYLSKPPYSDLSSRASERPRLRRHTFPDNIDFLSWIASPTMSDFFSLCSLQTSAGQITLHRPYENSDMGLELRWIRERHDTRYGPGRCLQMRHIRRACYGLGPLRYVRTASICWRKWNALKINATWR